MVKTFETKSKPDYKGKVIDLATLKMGLDFLLEYNDMVRKLQSKDFAWLKNHSDWIRKFQKGKG